MPKLPRALEMGIVVRDLEVMSAFYRDALGCRLIADLRADIGVMRRFACGDAQIKLLSPREAPHASNPAGGARAGCTGLRWFSLTVEGDLEETLERCVAAGAGVVTPVSGSYPGGPRYMVIEDPEGNWFEIMDGDLSYDEVEAFRSGGDR
ncbi:VOC family protein [Streptomyces chartreusis]|uniref:VOC family protein n=1 Tax=Streptomyces chartreusis TaxID=1969 RepID=UPI00363C9507